MQYICILHENQQFVVIAKHSLSTSIDFTILDAMPWICVVHYLNIINIIIIDYCLNIQPVLQ